MIHLADSLKCKIHVTRAQFARYRYFSKLKAVLTTDARETNIHFCQVPYSGWHISADVLPCEAELSSRPCNKITLVPTAMYFTTSKVSPVEMVKCETEKRIRVCYSTHCSYEEVIDFLSTLKPKAIYANVKPNSNLTLKDVENSLKHLERAVDGDLTKRSIFPPDCDPIVFKRVKGWLFPRCILSP